MANRVSSYFPKGGTLETKMGNTLLTKIIKDILQREHTINRITALFQKLVTWLPKPKGAGTYHRIALMDAERTEKNAKMFIRWRKSSRWR